jgi:hypothetical protein
MTAYSGVMLEKPVKKFDPFYGKRLFIASFTTARHLSLVRAKIFQATPLSLCLSFVVYKNITLKNLHTPRKSLNLRRLKKKKIASLSFFIE